MARVLAITNHKGGTAKTTTAVNMAAALSLRGYDVLLIDFDGQANATEILGVTPQPNQTTFDAMKQANTPYISPLRVKNPEPVEGTGVLDILPSCPDLSAINVGLAQEPDRLTRFGAVVDKYRDKYDIIVIDTPPTFGLLLTSALYAADETIVTVQPEYLAVRGLVALNNVIQTVNGNRTGGPLAVSVLLTLFDKRRGIHRLIAEQVAGAGFTVYGTKIRQNVSVCEAQASNVDIFAYNPNSNGALDYAEFTTEYLNGKKIKHTKHGYR